jgi:hypothetical protein
MSKKASPKVYVPSVGMISQSLMQKLRMRGPSSSRSEARGNINTFPSDTALESALREVLLEKPMGVLGSYLIPEASYKIQAGFSRKAIPKRAIKEQVIAALGRMVHLKFEQSEPYQSSFVLNQAREMILDLPSLDE